MADYDWFSDKPKTMEEALQEFESEQKYKKWHLERQIRRVKENRCTKCGAEEEYQRDD